MHIVHSLVTFFFFFYSWKENIQNSVHIKLYFFQWKPKVWQGYESRFCTPGWRWAGNVLGRPEVSRLADPLLHAAFLGGSARLLCWSPPALAHLSISVRCVICFFALFDSPYWHCHSVVFLFKEKQYNCREKHFRACKNTWQPRASHHHWIVLGRFDLWGSCLGF